MPWRGKLTQVSAAVEVGELLTRFRVARGMSQEQLALASGTGVRSIGDIERGRVRRPQRRTLAALAGALDLTSAERDELLRVERVARPHAHRRIAPLEVLPMIGRGVDLDQISRLLTVAGARLLTVVGPAGVGKSHLAAAALDRLSPVTRTVTVECQGGGVSDVLAGLALAGADGSRPVLTAPATVDDVVDAVGRDEVRILLDGVDPVPEMSCVLAALLARCPRLQLVLTARTAARIRGEHQWPLAGLVGEDGVALLVERTARIRPGFAADAAEPASVVGRLAGNPLGIEIAAGLLRGRDCGELDRTLAAVLPAGGDPLPALLRWRIRRLPCANRAALTVLSGHPAGVAAAEARAGTGDDWDDLVAALSGAALLRVADRVGRCWLRVPGAVRDVVADLDAAEGRAG